MFVDFSESMHCKISGVGDLGSVRFCDEIAVLLGVMINYASEKCDYYLFYSHLSYEMYVKIAIL